MIKRGVSFAHAPGTLVERKWVRSASEEASSRREAREVTVTADDTRSGTRRGCGRIRLAKAGTAATGWDREKGKCVVKGHLEREGAGPHGGYGRVKERAVRHI